MAWAQVNILMALVCIIHELFSPTLESERGQRLTDCRNLSLRHHCISSQELFCRKPLSYVFKLEPLQRVLRWGYFRFNDICVIHSFQVENKSHPRTALRKPKECFFPTSEPGRSMINRRPRLIHFTDCFCMSENKNKNINSTHAKYPSSEFV